MLCIKDNVQLLQFQFQYAQRIAFLMEFFALATMVIIKSFKELVVNVQMVLFGMEICVDGHQYVKQDILLITLLDNAKLLE